MVIKHAVVKAPGQTLAAVADWNADHTGTLNHGTELTNVLPDQHHIQLHNAASHTDIASTGAQIDDAVSKKHTQGTDTTLGAMTAVINMNTHQINNLVDPALNQDAATKKYVDDTAGGLWEVDGTETQLIVADEIDMQTKKIINLVDPTANQDAATKKWVEDQIPGVGTSYWNCPGKNFVAERPDVDDVQYPINSSRIIITAGTPNLFAPVFLPEGAVVTASEVFGDADAESGTWTLFRAPLATGTGVAMASAAVNTEDNTITNATIDNNTYCYFFQVTGLDSGDEIYGARITYTL